MTPNLQDLVPDVEDRTTPPKKQPGRPFAKGAANPRHFRVKQPALSLADLLPALDESEDREKSRTKLEQEAGLTTREST